MTGKVSAETPTPRATSRRRLLVGLYVAVALVGFVLGTSGRLPLHLVSSSHPLTPLARVGFALEKPTLPNDARAFETLANDLEVTVAALPPEDRGAFELLVAVRGLRSQGEPDWKRAAELCQRLGWPRCDTPSLEELARRSRP